MDRTHYETPSFGDRTIKVFDKHKSWYKVDIDGDFITKSTAPIKKMIVKPKAVSSIYLRPKHVEKTPKIQDVAPPKEISYVHELGMKLAVHIGVFLLFILSSLCGVSYLWPVRMSKQKPPKVEGVF